MKANFKPLGLAAAVAAASVGYAGVANAQSIAGNGLGDLAIIPYYTVQNDFVTGVHITNTSGLTQVVKLRLRRAKDSMDALDINLVLSPYDVWTGFLDDSSGNIVLATDDKSCTAPIRANGRFEMPAIYRAGAEEGYIEVIAMASADASQPISEAALHDSDGVPESCGAVDDNFFSVFVEGAGGGTELGDTSFIGNHGNYITVQKWQCDSDDEDSGENCVSQYEGSGNVLAVSYFIRDAASGLEFGGQAVHIANFMDGDGLTGGAMMSNQELGIFSGDPTGFDYPDLNGGLPLAGQRGLAGGPFDTLRAVMGIDTVLNDWSTASERNVATDWVVTFPGQYAMLDQPLYFLELLGSTQCGKPNAATLDPLDLVPVCDWRDIPVTATFVNLYDREEQTFSDPDGDLVISPNLTPQAASTLLRYEVNVIEWTDGSGADPVMDSDWALSVDTSALGQPYGWAELSVQPTKAHDQKICDFNLSGTPSVDVGVGRLIPYGYCSSAIDSGIPMVGFVAWERSFPQDPSANYGRIIDHSWTGGSAN